MWLEDIKLVERAVSKYGPVSPLFVEAGGLEDPTIADYSLTIEAVRWQAEHPESTAERRAWVAREAQICRYLKIHRPLEAALPGYICEDPGSGGASISGLRAHLGGRQIGCLVCLSTLEHCEEVWYAPEQMHDAMKPGGLLIVSVPWMFPYHPSPKDLWRFSPEGLRKLFDSPMGGFEILECDWGLRIPADAGVLEIHSMKPQAIESCFLIGRAK